jgi:hypothetical protein
VGVRDARRVSRGRRALSTARADQVAELNDSKNRNITTEVVIKELQELKVVKKE